MTKIMCPRCKQIGEYHSMCNFDSYICDCGCEFYGDNRDKTNEFLFGKNPFNGSIIRQHHDPICPGCGKESVCDVCCDNDCGTWECQCGQEFYIMNGIVTAGHFPKCGDD